jgi:hypothetical protein
VNRLFVQYLQRHLSVPMCAARVGYLDAFESTEGFSLRTTRHLLAADCRLLHSANRDVGIVRALRAQGVDACEGDWSRAVERWAASRLRFHAFFLDFCFGSHLALLQEVRRVESLLEVPCVLALTLLERDFSGAAWTGRAAHLALELSRQGWRPAADAGDVASSVVEYMSSGHQRVATQFWVRGDSGCARCDWCPEA